MAIVVIGGHSRSVGKTSVAAALIAALPEYNWTAFKITQYGHGICSRDGTLCHCATDDHAWAISEEKDLSGESDSSRFLQAGAVRAWWVRTEQGRLAEAVPAVRRRLAAANNAILESNSIMKFIRPDLYIPVLDPSIVDFKKSALEFLDLADSVVWNEAKDCEPPWKRLALKLLANRPVFKVRPPDYVTDEITAFVRERINLNDKGS